MNQKEPPPEDDSPQSTLSCPLPTFTGRSPALPAILGRLQNYEEFSGWQWEKAKNVVSLDKSK